MSPSYRPTPDCPECQGSGIVETLVPEYPYPLECVCKCLRVRGDGVTQADDMVMAGVPFRLAECTWNSFKPRDEHQRTAKARCQAYAEHARQGTHEGRWLLLKGEGASGKSHLAAAMTRALIDRAVKVTFLDASAWFETLRDLSMSRDNFSFRDAMREAQETPVLVLDDLGSVRSNEMIQERLWSLVRVRSDRGLPTLITTRRTLDALEPPLLLDVALTRLLGCCDVVLTSR